MLPSEWNQRELLSLSQVAARLRRANKPRHPQSLYDRIQCGGMWYIPEPYVEQLRREPYHPRGGRPPI